MKKFVTILLAFFIFFQSNLIQAKTIIFEEPKEKGSYDKVIYDLIAYSQYWYSAKRSFNLITYSIEAKKQKEKDLQKNEKYLSMFIQSLADKYKLYFEDIVDIFNEYNKKYYLQIAGDEKAPLIIIKIKNV